MNSIGFNNFRRFANFPEMDLGNITLLVGGNNSGKSTLVKALLLCLDNMRLMTSSRNIFGTQRINQNREFFRINVEQAQAILELFHHEDVTEDVSEEIQNDLTDEDKAASSKAQAKRPPLNFYEMGLQKGDVLIWKDDPSISVTILSERKVCYEGEETSISVLSAKLKGYKVKHIQPTPHWLFNDRLLSEIYDETYPFEE